MIRLAVAAFCLGALAPVARAQQDAVLDLSLEDAFRDRLVGQYSLSMRSGEGPTVRLRLSADGGRLTGRINDNDPTRMLYQGGRSFRPEDEPAVTLRVLEDAGLALETPGGPMDGVRVGDTDTDMATAGPLFDALLAADRELFDAIFVACDAERALEWFDADAEFYHDKGGRSVGEDVQAAVRSQAAGCPRENGTTREVDRESLFVSPIAGFGAVQTGTHRFAEAGGVTVARFVHVWRETPAGWRVHRVISYDHRPEGG